MSKYYNTRTQTTVLKRRGSQGCPRELKKIQMLCKGNIKERKKNIVNKCSILDIIEDAIVDFIVKLLV
jgi:hypothetical protein